jgi:hypothetical protein
MPEVRDQIQQLGGQVIADGLAERLVVALDPSPATREIVSRRIVEFAEELADEQLLGDVVTQIEDPTAIGASELAARAGVSYRQINYWTSCGWIVPTSTERGSGRVLAYPPSTIVKARIMGSLVRMFAMTPARSAELAEQIIRDGSATVGGFTITKDAR